MCREKGIEKMEFAIIITFLVCIIIILRILFGSSKKQIETIAKQETLDELAKKYPDNIDICKEYLNMLHNKNVKVEEDKNATNSLYIALSNKIIIADVKESYTRIQTIAHECLHSIQDRKILVFNFIYSNLYILYFLIISILKLFNILPYEMMFLTILIVGGFIYYFVRSYLENDAMIKARFLAKDYMEYKKISSQEEIDEIVGQFDKLNDVGIRTVNYMLLLTVMIQIIIFCGICIIR